MKLKAKLKGVPVKQSESLVLSNG